MRKLLIGFLFFLVLTTVYSLRSTVYAAGEFETSYKVNYQVAENGRAQVTQNITLKNKTTNFYADKFELKIGSTKVEDVKATDSAGALATDVKFENNVTTISVKFNQKVIGIDKTLPWTLTYSSTELTSRSGQIWEVSIPRLAKSADIADYNATVTAPITFGPVAFAVPTPQTSTRSGPSQLFTFGKDQLEASGIAMSFGTKQVFAFTLDYYLENPNITTQTEEIALPPDNNYQKIVLQKMDPPPLDVIVDKDNNFLAVYKLASKQQLNVKASGYVEVFSRPFRNIYAPLTAEEKRIYTESDRYWETDNSFIRNKADELKTPDKIYKFVTTYLSYSEERLKQAKIERKGAAAAALSPKDAVCMEFTDLFIAIARAAGIPAREVEGYAYTQNERLRPLSLTTISGDVLHAWPEYWDDNLGWVQVDPTWGATSGGLDFFEKLDFNHITFIERGTSSTSPYPAGSYKKQGNGDKKDIQIDFAVELPNITATPEISMNVPDKILSGIPVKITAIVKNIGSSSILGQKLELKSKILKKINNLKNPNPQMAEGEMSTEIKILPPFAHRQYDFNLQTTGNLFKTVEDVLVLSYFNNQIAQPVEIIPIYSVLFLKNFLIVAALAIGFILLGLFLYYRFHRKNYKKIRN